MILFLFLYNYLSRKKLNATNWQYAKIFGLLLMPLAAIVSPIVVLMTGLWVDQASFADPKCGMPDLSFTLLCWLIGLPLSLIMQIAFNKEYYKLA